MPPPSGAASAARTGPPTSISRAATSIAAGSSPRCGPGSSPTAAPPTGSCSPTASLSTRSRKKISKSSTYEKPQTSDSYIAEYGADVMRLWISSQNFRDDIPISKEILSHVGETYRLRETPFASSSPTCSTSIRPGMPSRSCRWTRSIAWALHQTAELLRQCTAAYEAYEFHRSTSSATNSARSRSRRLPRYPERPALHAAGRPPAAPLVANRPPPDPEHAGAHFAPIITFTRRGLDVRRGLEPNTPGDSVHLQDWPVAPADWSDAVLAREFEVCCLG